MNSKINDLIDKYYNINFTYKKDKEFFLSFLNNLDIKNDKVSDLIDILEYNLTTYSKFDNSILYNPLSLIDAIIENDLDWKKIDNDEFLKIIKNITDFQDYISWIIEEKEFIEKKYYIKINILKENVQSINAWIFWQSFDDNMKEIFIIKKIDKLLDFYPVNFIKNIWLKEIIIVKFFYKEDLYWQKIKLWWFETSSDNNIYLSYDSLVESFDHELFHQAMQYYNDFSKWQKIREKQNKLYLYKDIYKKDKWFARNYWKENISEDQATIAEELIINHYDLMNRIKNDDKLYKKVKLVKEAYLKLSDWLMDEKFWNIKFPLK